jgi:hypothetical protein
MVTRIYLTRSGKALPQQPLEHVGCSVAMQAWSMIETQWPRRQFPEIAADERGRSLMSMMIWSQTSSIRGV